LGPHRLICGDSTQAEVAARALEGVTPQLMVTDPPYGVEYDADWRNRAARSDGSMLGAQAVGVVQNDDQASWLEAYRHFEGDVAYVWHADRFASVVERDLAELGFELRAQIIWAKTNFAISRGHYHYQHEPCWYAVRKGGTGHWAGDRKQTTLWQIEKPQKSETGHSTQKPIECMARPIRNHTVKGDVVYDPFSGSGTTIMACEQMGRVARVVEIHPPYVALAIERWHRETGLTPELIP
jgi:DNA modification methylase